MFEAINDVSCGCLGDWVALEIGEPGKQALSSSEIDAVDCGAIWNVMLCSAPEYDDGLHP